MRKSLAFIGCLALVLSVGSRPSAFQKGTVAPASSPSPGWDRGFHVPGTERPVLAWEIFDDGNGPAVYAGGQFRFAGGERVNGIARWNGSSWEPVGSGVGSFGTVHALAVFDDGTGPALYAGGQFSSIDGLPAEGLARFDGEEWSPLTGVGTSGRINTLEVATDSLGTALFVGGLFTSVGGIQASNVARYDGSWSPMPGLFYEVFDLEGFLALDGPVMYAGTTYLFSPFCVWRWNGASWVQQLEGPSSEVYALEVYDDGNGPKLYAGGNFLTTGVSNPAPHIAVWDGVAWGAAGDISPGTSASVYSLEVLEAPGGDLLVAGGVFDVADGQPVDNVAVYDGVGWAALSAEQGPDSTVRSVAALDTGEGPELYFGGNFLSVAGQGAAGAAKWNLSWSRMGDGAGVDERIEAAAVHDDGTGPALYVGGELTQAGLQTVSHLARWTGSAWEDVGGGVDGWVQALASADLGGGPTLFAGGRMATAGGGAVQVNGLAAWDGTSWAGLGTGLSGGSVEAVADFDDGTGPTLFAGGLFTAAGGVATDGIARWDGTAWSAPVGGPLSAPLTGGRGLVYSLEVHDDGTGPALYVGGRFEKAGAQSVGSLARWDGSGWEALPGGQLSNPPASVVVNDLLSTELPPYGRVLVVAGNFQSAGSVATDNVAIWDGSGWIGTGVGVVNGLGGTPHDVEVFDAGSGPQLFVGRFAVPNGLPGLMSWNGRRWLKVADWAGFATVKALKGFDDGSGPGLFVGGEFYTVGRGVPSRSIGRLRPGNFATRDF